MLRHPPVDYAVFASTAIEADLQTRDRSSTNESKIAQLGALFKVHTLRVERSIPVGIQEGWVRLGVLLLHDRRDILQGNQSGTKTLLEISIGISGVLISNDRFGIEQSNCRKSGFHLTNN